MAELQTVAEWARGLGMSRQAGHQAVQRCNIPLFDGKVDPGVATVLYQQRTRSRVKAGAPAPAAPAEPVVPDAAATGEDYQAIRVERERIQLERDRRENDREARLLCRVDRAERGAFDAFRELRDATFSSMKSAARKVIGMTEIRDVELALEDAVREAYATSEQRLRAKIQEASNS